MISSGAITVERDKNDDGDVLRSERDSATSTDDGETRLISVRRQVRSLVCLLFIAFLLDGILWAVVGEYMSMPSDI